METNTPKEYDLMDLLLAMWRGVVALFAGCKHLLIGACRLTYRYKRVMLVALLLGTAWGGYFAFRHRLTIVHTAESQLRIYVGGPYLSAEQLQYLDKLAATENHKQIAELTGLTLEQAKNIKAVRSYFVLTSPYDGVLTETDYQGKFIKDTTALRSPSHLTVQVDIANPRLADSLAFALETFLRGSSFMQAELDIERQHLQVLRAQYQAEVAALDSLRNLEYFDEQRNVSNLKLNGGVFVNERTHYLYHNDIVGLRDAVSSVDTRLAQVDRIVDCQHAFYLKKISFTIIFVTLKRIIFLCFLFLLFIWLYDSRSRIQQLLKA